MGLAEIFQCLFCSSPVTVPLIFCIPAATLTFLFTSGCAFFYFHHDQRDYGYGLYQKGIYLEDENTNGLVSSAEQSYTCSPYLHTIETDPAFDFSRGIATTAAILSAPTLLVLLMPLCFAHYARMLFTMAGGFCILQGIMSIFALVALSSMHCKHNPLGTECMLGRDAYMCISASLLWLIAATIICCGPAARDDYLLDDLMVDPAAAGVKTIDSSRDLTKAVDPSMSSDSDSTLGGGGEHSVSNTVDFTDAMMSSCSSYDHGVSADAEAEAVFGKSHLKKMKKKAKRKSSTKKQQHQPKPTIAEEPSSSSSMV